MDLAELWNALSHDIFTDLATPNNHCLNTLLIQWSSAAFGVSAFYIRLPVLIFGCLTLFLGCFCVWRLTHSRPALFFTSALLSFQPMLVHYSATARGYSIQSFFVLVMTLLLLASAPKKRNPATAFSLLLAAIASCLSVTAGLVFVCAFCGAYFVWLIPWRQGWKSVKEHVPFLCAGLLFCIFALCWYGSQYTKLKQGQQFGTDITGPGDLLTFCWNTFSPMWLPLLLLLLAAVFCPKGRRMALFFLTSFVLVVLSAVFTKAGPPRTYMAAYAPLILGAALILPELFARVKLIQRWQFPVVFLLVLPELLTCPQRINNIVPPQWSKNLPPILAELPPKVIISYGNCDGLSIRSNCPLVLRDSAERLAFPIKTCLVCIEQGDHLDIADARGQTNSLNMEFFAKDYIKSNNLNLTCYNLVPLTSDTQIKNETLLIHLFQLPEQSYGLFLQSLLQLEPELGVINMFMLGGNQYLEQMQIRTCLFICCKAQKSAAEYLDITQRSNGKVRFYRFARKDLSPAPMAQ